MSTSKFDPRDRADMSFVSTDIREQRIRFMARSGGYVMVRRPRCVPFCLTEKQWAKLPFFEALTQKDRPDV